MENNIHVLKSCESTKTSIKNAQQILCYLNDVSVIILSPPTSNLSNFEFSDLNTNIVILCRDHDIGHENFNKMLQIAKHYSHKNFIFSTSFYSAYSLYNIKNLITVPYIAGNDSFLNVSEYNPVEKNLNSTEIGISLNRQNRKHRLMLSSYLVGDPDIYRTMYVTMLHIKYQIEKTGTYLLDAIDYDFSEMSDLEKDIMQNGYETLAQRNFKEIYKLIPGTQSVNGLIDNKSHWTNEIQYLFKNSFVEFIATTTFDESNVLHDDEKLIQNIMGMNFPVFVTGQYSVQTIRDIMPGLDLFDDIVDHLYDHIEDPVKRFIMAIRNNKHLLEDIELTKQLWLKNKYRFESNIRYLKSGKLTEDLNQRTIEHFLKYIPNKFLKLKYQL